MATYDIDFSALPTTTSYANSDLTVYGNPAAIRNGKIQSRDRPAKSYITHVAPMDAAGNIDITVTVGFGSGAFNMTYGGVGIFHKDTYDSLMLRLRFGEVRLYRRSQNGTITGVGDFSNVSYSAGDTFTFRFNRDLTQRRLQSFHNGVLVKTVDSPFSDISNYRAGMFLDDEGQDSTDGFSTFNVVGLDIADPASIKGVGTANTVTQYQQAVSVELEGLDTADLTAAVFAGEAITTTVVDATHFTFNVPGDLSSGTYTLTATVDGTEYSRLVTYIQTHALKVPDAGTAVDTNSVMAQLGNPENGRYIRLEKPAGLSWKSPYTAWTTDNIILDISELFTAPAGAPTNSTYESPGSLIDINGVVQDFTMSFQVLPEENENAFILVIKPTYQAIYDVVAD